MKKILSTLTLLTLLSLPMMVASQATQAPLIDPIEALKMIVNWLFLILLIFAALMIIVAAFYFVTAAGDPEKTKTARNFVLWAIIGVIVAFLAKGLVWIVGRMLGYEVTW